MVDDDLGILEGVAGDLEEEGYLLSTANCGEAALELFTHNHYDLVLTDLVMQNVDGLQVIKAAKKYNPDIMGIILTGYGNLDSAIDALRLRADDYLLKPCEGEEISYRVRRCLAEQRLRAKVKIYEKILPVCCVCKKIRDDSGTEPGRGNWMELEIYLSQKAGIDITSTYCPECAAEALQGI